MNLKKIKISAITLFLLFKTFSFSNSFQDSICITDSFSYSISTSGATNGLGDIFLFPTKTGNIIKINKSGQDSVVYTSTWGEISRIEKKGNISTLLFFKDFQRAIILNRLYIETFTIDFSNYSFQNVNTVCWGADNSLWIIDNVDQKISKLALNRNQITYEQELNFNNEIVWIYEHQGYLFTLTDNGNLYWQEINTMTPTLLLTEVSNPQLEDNQLWYEKNNTVFKMNLYPVLEEKKSIAINNNHFLLVDQNIIFLNRKEKLYKGKIIENGQKTR